jgi:hypothetical protein
MKNSTKILIGLAVAGTAYAVWRFVIKDKLAARKAKLLVDNYDQFEDQRELIANSLPQETETTEFEQIT